MEKKSLKKVLKKVIEEKPVKEQVILVRKGVNRAEITSSDLALWEKDGWAKV